MYYLVGNPYASALDAEQFIWDNLDSTSGVLYFWEHWGNDSHVLSQYQAGYATYNISGGVAAVNFNDNTVSLTGKIPGDYIPVAQGFYVNSYNSSGGNIKFNNNQRIYVTEASSESTFFKSAIGKKEDLVKEVKDKRLKIRVSLETEHIANKQILLTIDERATDGIDKGFDAQPFDLLNNDIYWVVEDEKLVIQALGELFEESEVPIGIITLGTTDLKIKVDTIQNPYPNMEVYIRDNLTMETYDIKNGAFEINLSEGEYNDKYSIVFKPKEEIPVEVEEIFNSLNVFVNENNNFIRIQKPEELIIYEISLFNVIGQQLKTWKTNFNENEINLPVNVAVGVYLVNIRTDMGNKIKKLVIK